MRRDGRLSVALHLLLHMAELGRVVTSETLAHLMKGNAVVVRRTLGGLRAAGIVSSEKGHGGGWSLARELDAVTLGDVYDALGIPTPFTLGHRETAPRCMLEQEVNRVLGEALGEAEALLLAKLRSTTVAAVTADARKARKAHGTMKGEHSHA